MFYKNLVEDENEARTERVGMRFAYVLIAFGILVIGMNYFGKKKLNINI